MSRTGVQVTPGGTLPARVASVNLEARFVVLSFPLGQTPVLERRLGVYRQGLRVGEIKISGPQREQLVVADIVAGECQVGDEVRED